MGFLQSLFGKKKPEITITMHVEDDYVESEVSRLLRQATAKKDAGDLEGAIATLKQAYGEMAKEEMDYGIDPLLRLPMYLQAAGRNDEAWGEFNRLILESMKKAHDPILHAIEQAAIHDKMRLFLQREGKNAMAVRFGVMAHMYEATSLYRQNQVYKDRPEALTEHMSKERLEKDFGRMLKRAKKEELLPQIIEIISSYGNKLPKIHMPSLLKEMDAVLFAKGRK